MRRSRRYREPTDTFGMPDPNGPHTSGFWPAMRSLVLGFVVSILIGGAVMGWVAWVELLQGWSI